MSVPEDSIPMKERFAYLLAEQKLVLDRFADAGFKIPAVLSVVLGWMVSSETAQRFLNKAPQILWLVLITVAIVVTVLIVWTLVRTNSVSIRLHARLKTLAYADEEYFKYYRVSRHMFLGVVALNALLCALLIGGIIYIRFSLW